MTHVDDLEAAIIAATRRARTPSAETSARVRAGAMTAVAAGRFLPPPSWGERLADAASDALESLTEAPTQARVLLGVATLSAVGAGGYALGLEAGRAESRPPSPVSPVSSSQAESVRAPAGPVAPAAPAVASVMAEPPPDPAPTTRRRSRAVAPLTPAVEPRAIPADEELRAMRRVERALREGNPRLALVLLEDLDRAVSGGTLKEEREAARSVATCQLDPAASVATSRAAEFTRRHPNSVYAARVRSACDFELEGERKRPPVETD